MKFLELTDVLGNIGEFVGVIAVLVTLGYLTVQIRQNTQALRFQSGRESARLHTDIAITLMLAEIGEVLARSTRGGTITDAEHNHFDQRSGPAF